MKLYKPEFQACFNVLLFMQVLGLFQNRSLKKTKLLGFVLELDGCEGPADFPTGNFIECNALWSTFLAGLEQFRSEQCLAE